MLILKRKKNLKYYTFSPKILIIVFKYVSTARLLISFWINHWTIFIVNLTVRPLIFLVISMIFNILFFLQMYCRFLHVMLQFFMVANYMWMFCEGLHLHMALVVVFVNDVYAMRWFYAIGWGLPIVLTTLYVSWRSCSKDTTLWVLCP